MNCIAPGEDTTYQFSGKLPLDDHHVLAIVSPLGINTGTATYVGLGLNSSLRQLGFANLSDEDLAGTANGYTSAVPSDKFFVYYFARDCTGLREKTDDHCYSVGDKVPMCFEVANPECDMLNLSLRGYIRPGTQRASDAWSLLNARTLVLQK